MGLTSFGIIWIILILIFVIKNKDNIYIFLALSSIFQAASIIYIGDNYLTPFLFTELIFLIICFPKSEHFLKYNKTYFTLVVFTILSVISTLILPFFFKGIYVRPNFIGNTYLETVHGGIPLSFSMSNVNQIVLLIINTLTCYVIFERINMERRFKLQKGVVIAIICVCILGAWDFFSRKMDFYFPRGLVFNNLSYGEIDFTSTVLGGIYRFIGTFTEASYCGAFLAASFWFLFFKIKLYIKYLYLIIFVVFALILNLSGTGMATFIMGFLLFMLYKRRFNYIIFSIIGIGIIYGIIYIIGYDYLIQDMLFNKADSLSGITRKDLNSFSWNITLNSYGLGVGLGSNRAASLFFMLLSNVGFMGTILFFYFLFKLVKVNISIGSNHAPEIFFFILILFAQLISIPDLSFPLLWTSIFLLIPKIYSKKIVSQ